MQYPKVWGEGSQVARIVGEARERGLQMVNSPYLSASGPGFSAHKKGQFSEVHITGEAVGGEVRTFITWHYMPYYSPFAPLFTQFYQPEYGFFRGEQPGRKLFKRLGVLADHPQFVYIPSINETTPSTIESYRWVVPRPCLESFRFGRDVLRVSDEISSAKTRALVTRIYRIGPDGKRVKEVIETEGKDSNWMYYDRYDTDDEATNHAIHCASTGGASVWLYQSRQGLLKIESSTDGLVATQTDDYLPPLYRASPTKLVSWYIPETIMIPTVSYLETDNSGNITAEFDEPAASALVYPEGDTWLQRRFLPVPLNTGEFLVFSRSWRGGGGFDVDNVIPYPSYDGDFPPPRTQGALVFRGSPGSLAVVQRIQIPDMTLDVLEANVSGSTVVAVVAQAWHESVGSLGTLSVLYYGYYRNSRTVRLWYTTDNGDTWALFDTGLAFDNVGSLSVSRRGKFLLPISNGVEWEVKEFAVPSAEWKTVARIPRDAYLTGWSHKAGAVLEVGPKADTNPMPGAPWVCDENVPPPWV
jgi:hypothetical protein